MQGKNILKSLMLIFAAGLIACQPATDTEGPPSTEPDAVSPAAALDLSRFEVVDLTHPFDEDTLYWPTEERGFELEVLHHDFTDDGYFYSAMRFCTAEHGGTHLDAPIHFAEGMHSTEEIPLEQLIGPAVVIDVTDQAADDPDYRLDPEQVELHEAEHGQIPEGAIVLLRTGWSRHWPDPLAYLGDDTPGDASGLRFPSYGEQAAQFLIDERRVSVLGVDTASIDYGQSEDFMVHRIAARSNVPGLENLTNLDHLPPTGAWVIALPMKITDGSGAPLRAVALLP